MQQRIDYANTLINMKKTYKNMCIAILYMKVITNSMDNKEIISLMKEFFLNL